MSCMRWITCLLFAPTLVLGGSVHLYQKDFARGTYIIDKPGTYVLDEDIRFNPNSTTVLNVDAYGSGFVRPEQYQSKGGEYPDTAFGLGFFAAISITASEVVLDLNGHRIEQSKEHALLQRFFAVIELANQPFIPDQGPHNFGSTLIPANDVTIKNGTIGRSAHHGVHGNGNRNIRIEGISFEDFEVAAVALNGVQGLLVENCTARSSRDVTVLGTYSSARFLQPYLDYLAKSQSPSVLNIAGNRALGAQEAAIRLRKGINAVHKDLIVLEKDHIDKDRNPQEYALFHNPEGVIDGNCYGFLINSFGQAVEGFPVRAQLPADRLARDIHFNNVTVEGLKGRVTEVIAMNHDSKAMTDPVGSVFQVMNVHPDTKELITVSMEKDQQFSYKGNLLADAQALVAKAYYAGDFKNSSLDLSRITITKEAIDWIESRSSSKEIGLEGFAPNQQNRLCNADSMFHVNKGVIGFKIDGATNVQLDNIVARNIVNLSEMGSGACGKYTRSHPKATLEGCGGPKTRGYSLAGSSNIKLHNCVASDIRALCGTAAGFDILTDSENVSIEKSSVHSILAGRKFRENKGPNEHPMAIGFRIGVDTHNISLVNICAYGLYGYDGAKDVLDESQKATVSKDCKHIR